MLIRRFSDTKPSFALSLPVTACFFLPSKTADFQPFGVPLFFLEPLSASVPRRPTLHILQQWSPQASQEQHARASSLPYSTNPSYGDCGGPLQLDLGDGFGGLLADLSSWDQAANLDLGPVPQTACFPATDLDFSAFDPTPCLDFPAPAPLFDDFFPSLPGTSTETGLTTTPSVTTTASADGTVFPSPSPAPPSPEDNAGLIPGLKLPPSKPHSRPGRRPARAAAAAAAASSGRVCDGRVSKPASRSPSSAAAAVDEDPEVIERRQRNNLAAKRCRQRKIDRILALEDEVKRVTQERDELRIRLARQEAEVAALREMLGLRGGDGKKGDEEGNCRRE